MTNMINVVKQYHNVKFLKCNCVVTSISSPSEG